MASHSGRGGSHGKADVCHLALFARDPKKLADFYTSVFDMEIAQTNGRAYFLTDGYLMLAILPHRLEGEAAVGLNHFGFNLESRDETVKKLEDVGRRGAEGASRATVPMPNSAPSIPKATGSTSPKRGSKDDEGVAKRKKQLETTGTR